ncbi:LANO_0G01970g1_1 [Lachancea nothofagi CBS 11611]|uniref:Post-GPI attachment to proteins factor 3 n=1 Tax=Lachancea nothofagi CBS 11611 TaxID=1266666 RepID=A0A1G4KF14_9SACH|nr:LANO_0G01970g1_1 [Lachancea nothofagi CBS 11611]
MLHLWSLLSLVGAIKVVSGSEGDRLYEFEACKDHCQASLACFGFENVGLESADWKNHGNFQQASPIMNHLLLWDCESNCDYQCQQLITQERVLDGDTVVQFHGKWPFKRILGMQEFFSTVFSVANFVPHYRGYKMLRKELNAVPKHKKSRRLLQKYVYVALAGMLAWFSSSVFHFRDLEVTEKLDYFFAGATVLSGFHAILIRIARLDKQDEYRHLVSGAVLLIFTLHILRQCLDWSYTYNMRFNVLFGVFQYILLLILAYMNYRRLMAGRQPRKTYNVPRRSMFVQLCVVPTGLVICTALAMSCELYDFFNYDWQIDSHAIWHACTVLPSWKLYEFFIQDFRYFDACDAATVD